MTVDLTTITKNRVRLETIPAESYALLQELSRATVLSQRETQDDWSLTPEGKAERLSTNLTAIQSAARTQFSQLKLEGNSAFSILERAASENRPRRGNDAASLIHTQQRWEQSKEILAAGVELKDLVSMSDLDTTLAIEEFAPAWLVAQGYRKPALGEQPSEHFDNPRALINAVRTRLIELTTGATAEAMKVGKDAAIHIAQAELWWTQLDNALTGTRTDYLGTAVTVEYMGHELSTRPTKNTHYEDMAGRLR